jgi:TonB family protein
MRQWLGIALLTVFAGVYSSPAVLAQEQQSESQRKVVKREIPTYPELARQANLEGSVKLLVTVAPNGTAKSAEAVGGSPVLVRAAQDAIYKWKWAPAPQQSKEIVEFRFHPD